MVKVAWIVGLLVRVTLVSPLHQGAEEKADARVRKTKEMEWSVEGERRLLWMTLREVR